MTIVIDCNVVDESDGADAGNTITTAVDNRALFDTNEALGVDSTRYTLGRGARSAEEGQER